MRFKTIKVGDTVKIAKKWLNSPSEAKLRYEVIEVVDDTLDIRVLDSNLALPPIERVKVNMVVKVK